ncbi:hypothetical protein MalM25_23580 [Planctomycetes bacterium MalM25]|nr:hypothetical protein MalM25_23580 [Planctomycetes bacterium MalM25]
MRTASDDALIEAARRAVELRVMTPRQAAEHYGVELAEIASTSKARRCPTCGAVLRERGNTAAALKRLAASA